MKRKVTQSLSPDALAKLQQRKHKDNTSMSKEVDRMVEADPEVPKAGEHSALYNMAGAFADWFDNEDFEADDRAGEELRKTTAYQHRLAQRKGKKKTA